MEQKRRDFLKTTGMVAAGGLATAAMPRRVRAQAAKAKVTIVNAGGGFSPAMEELLRRQGYLDEFNLDAKQYDVADSSKIISAILGGDVDICMMAGFGQALPAIEKGAKLKVLAAANRLAPDTLFSAKPDVKTVQDLAGRTVGTGPVGAVLYQITVALLQKKGVDPSKVKFVNIGTTTDILKAVAAGTIDAGVLNVDTYGIADKYKIHPVADFFKELTDYPFQGTFTSQNAIDTKRDVLVRAMAAYSKGYAFVLSPGSKQAYVEACVANGGGTAEAAAAQWQFMQDTKCYDPNLVLPEKSITYMQQLNVQMGVQKAILPNDQVADMSLARDAVKLARG